MKEPFMGMFDFLKCDYPLPIGYEKLQDHEFQTKDTPEQYLLRYLITKDGRLKEGYEKKEEVVAEETEQEEGSRLSSLIKKRKEQQEEFLDFHGDINFYTILSKKEVVKEGETIVYSDELESYGFSPDEGRDTKWIEFCVRFTNGKLEWLKAVTSL